MAEGIVKVMPIDSKEKEAYLYYRKGLAAQNDGDYSEALEYYEESLKLEDNQVDRGETLKNMAIIYMSNGDEERAINTYKKALGQNPKQPSCLKNMGLIYEKRGRMAQRNEYRGAIQFLCSNASKYMNGQNIIIDGGRSVWWLLYKFNYD